ncbi:hypothetical protein QD460_24400 [Rhizobium jaguaris]|uniref:hypothetical protein n=1 Tax=Rhizobium jaguaris TaxID=1312183 RepID=UPI0039BF0BE2
MLKFLVEQMTRKALIKEAELRRMAKLAKQFGVVVEQEFNGIKIRVSPVSEGSSKPDAASDALNEWRSRKGGNNSAKESWKPDSAEDRIGEWYDSLGYDPKTMDSSDLKRLMNEAEERWLATIPNRPMLKSEKSTLRQLRE